MYFSLTFGEGTNVRNTWDDWHLIPKSRPLVAPPQTKTEYVDIPGADGSLDYTEVLAGVKFKDREGTWEFAVENGHQDWNLLYMNILRFLNGQRMKVTLESDPGYYYYGRFFVDSWNSSNSDGFSSVTIKYIIQPYKYPVSTTGDYDWQWDELQFVSIYEIYYGTFDVSGTKDRNLINPRSVDVYPSITCSTQMSVEFNGRTYTLSEGSSVPFALTPGNNNMVFSGNGRVTVDYSTGRTI